ncbi:MAG: thiamine diphosphokinase [Clostridia bacterium]|nr:thiamine diphosphokinase [Clostridia bacterium]
MIICAGECDFSRADISETDFIICADGGLHYALEMAIIPDVVIGDFDSFSGDLPKDAIILDRHKDDTDAEAALKEALQRGFSDIVFLAAAGGRIDHLLGNIGLLFFARQKGVCAKMLTADCVISVVSGCEKIDAAAGDTVSFIPIGEAHGVTLRGFEYLTDNADFSFSKTLGISNVAHDNPSVSIEQGAMICVVGGRRSITGNNG